jgi:spermidine/putrescine transport system ATP-binding protein
MAATPPEAAPAPDGPPEPVVLPAHGGEVRLVGLRKAFGDTEAVSGIDLTVEPGEFFSLLGPSGCGKTTTLRMIAGFERPTKGQILLDGEDVAQVPPNKRGVNTVFQNYALFPHLNVHDNVAFGLRFRDMPKDQKRAKVQQALTLVHLAGFDQRRPSQLSGGQQQRVALARALILEPKVLLLDEPLGALDAKLRKALQVELKALQEEVGITFIYVTHDQEEALTMSDRLAVMNAGRIEQVGPPRAVYEEPDTTYVADFLGVSNLMDATVEGRSNGVVTLAMGDFRLQAEAGEGEVPTAGAVKVTIRPERIRLEPHRTSGTGGGGDGGGGAAGNRIPAMVERLVFLGNSTQVIVRLAPGDSLQALIQNDGDEPPYSQGTPVSVVLPADALRVLSGS